MSYQRRKRHYNFRHYFSVYYSLLPTPTIPAANLLPLDPLSHLPLFLSLLQKLGGGCGAGGVDNPTLLPPPPYNPSNYHSAPRAVLSLSLTSLVYKDGYEITPGKVLKRELGVSIHRRRSIFPPDMNQTPLTLLGGGLPLPILWILFQTCNSTFPLLSLPLADTIGHIEPLQ